MTYLIDTHAIIWFMKGDSMLSEKAREIILTDYKNCYISAVSFWEMAIKTNINKLDLGLPFEEVEKWAVENGLSNFLHIEIPHTVILSQLPFHHRDPFDRTLIAQALSENLTIITKEKLFEDYGVACLWEKVSKISNINEKNTHFRINRYRHCHRNHCFYVW